MGTAEYLAIVAVLERPHGCPVPDEGSAQDQRLGAIAGELLAFLERVRRMRSETPTARVTIALSSTLATVLRHERVVARLERRISARPADDAQRALWEEIDGDLVAAIADLEESGHLEVLACPASSVVLPLLASLPRAIAAQLAVGCLEHTRLLGHRPRGLWLPACAYAPVLDEWLAREGLRFVVLARHGLAHATPRPLFGVAAPIVTPTGVAAFAATEGAPTPDPALDRPALRVQAHELDLPGSADAIDAGLRVAAHTRLVTLTEYLALHPQNQRSTPATSSAEADGFFEHWLGHGGAPIRHVHAACRRMSALARRHPLADGLMRRTLDQAARELLLLQSRDHLEPGAPARDFATHLSHFVRLAAMVESGTPDESRVAVLERRSPVFPLIDFRSFA